MNSVFGELVEFRMGRNTTRQDNKTGIYSLDDFYDDLYGRNGDVCEDFKIAVSLTKNKSTVMSQKTVKKELSSIFLIGCPNVKIVDPWYFCYLFNEDKGVSEQMRRLQQGTFGCIAKLNVKTISMIEASIQPLEKQVVIGKTYREMLRNIRLRREQADNMSLFMLETLKKLN